MKTTAYGTPLPGDFDYVPKPTPVVEPVDDPNLLVAAHTPVRDFVSTTEKPLTSEVTAFTGLRLSEPGARPSPLGLSYWQGLSREIERAMVGEEQRQKREVDRLFREVQKTTGVDWK